MQIQTSSRLALGTLLTLASVFFGCADVNYDEGRTANLETTLLNGMTVRLGRLSTDCTQRTFDDKVLASL